MAPKYVSIYHCRLLLSMIRRKSVRTGVLIPSIGVRGSKGGGRYQAINKFFRRILLRVAGFVTFEGYVNSNSNSG